MLIAWYLKAFALTGRQVCVRNYPGRCPGLGASALSGRVELSAPARRPGGFEILSPARRPGGFEIRRKKRFDLLKPGDL